MIPLRSHEQILERNVRGHGLGRRVVSHQIVGILVRILRPDTLRICLILERVARCHAIPPSLPLLHRCHPLRLRVIELLIRSWLPTSHELTVLVRSRVRLNGFGLTLVRTQRSVNDLSHDLGLERLSRVHPVPVPGSFPDVGLLLGHLLEAGLRGNRLDPPLLRRVRLARCLLLLLLPLEFQEVLRRGRLRGGLGRGGGRRWPSSSQRGARPSSSRPRLRGQSHGFRRRPQSHFLPARRDGDRGLWNLERGFRRRCWLVHGGGARFPPSILIARRLVRPLGP